MAKGNAVTPITEDAETQLARMACPDWLARIPLADDDDLGDRIVTDIMGRDTVDDVLNAGPAESVSFRDMAGDDVTIHDIRRRPSDTDSELGWYALMACTHPGDSEQFIATCGARNVLAQLVRLYQLDKLPITVNIYATPSKTNPKRSVLRLRAPGTF